MVSFWELPYVTLRMDGSSSLEGVCMCESFLKLSGPFLPMLVFRVKYCTEDGENLCMYRRKVQLENKHGSNGFSSSVGY